mmetsp:Transcript_12208/g.26998  ORF Transcript_12208/g.26998 Transcript_12208/m.26998 type:complete len:223 (+) Transcript_12208:189-857(+)
MMLQTPMVYPHHDPFYTQQTKGLKRAFSSGLEENVDVAAFQEPKKIKVEQSEEPSNEDLDFWGWLSSADLLLEDTLNVAERLVVKEEKQPEKRKGHKLTKRRSSKGPTAMEIFLKYIVVHDSGTVDCSGLISKKCYREWLMTRRKVPVRPEETFRKAILQHITCTDGGSNPFPAHIEKELLEMLRTYARVWPCFEGSLDKNGQPIKIGVKGLRAQGYHESRR